MNGIKYQNFRKDLSVVDDFNGVKVEDPYRWLEDSNSEETKAFVDAQNDITTPFINSCEIKDKINKRLTEMWDFPRYGCPTKEGSHYFYYYNTGLQNQSVLYMLDDLEGEPRVFFDPNSLSSDGTVAVNGTSFSEDGEYFAYGLSTGGSDWIQIKFKKVSTGKDLPDVLNKVKFSCMSWTHDSKGMFYNCFPDQEGASDGTETTSNLNHKLKYHRLGTNQEEDVLCMEMPDKPKWMIGAEVSECGRFVLITIHEGCEPKNLLYFCDLETISYDIKGMLPLQTVVDKFEAVFDYATNEGSLFTFRTNLNAPLYKLITIDFNNFQRETWKDLIPADDKSLLEWASCVNQNSLIVCHLKDVKSVLSLHNATTGEKKCELPLSLGTIDSTSGKKKLQQTFFRLVSFLSPGIIYKYDLTDADKPNLTVYREIAVSGFDPARYEVKQVFFSSKDGTKIPMFIVKSVNVKLDGSNPCLLYGYGGFDISITPSFSVSRLLFMQHFGGIVTIANIRGGGEYGEKWHDSGRLALKQNCFDDFQAAAKFLTDQGYTNSSRLVIQGGSNGGLLVGACINQSPELFGAAIAQVGVMDMLRFHKFTIGHAWTSDFGSPDIPDQFNYIYKYSPLHNLAAPIHPSKAYPAVLLLTADHDDRVVPLHSLKFAARLQEIVGQSEHQTKPLLIRIDVKAGHGAGKPTTKTIQELTDIYSFLQLTINLEWRN